MGLFDKLFGGSKSKSKPSAPAFAASALILESLLPGLSQVSDRLGGEFLEPFIEQGIDVSKVLPKITEFETPFEKLASGKLTPFETTIFDTILGRVTGDIGESLRGFGAQVPGTGASAPRFTPPPNIGTLTSQIMQSLPQEMQTFISNIFQDSSPEAIQRELDNFSQAMLAQAQANAESLGGQLLNRLASEGFGTSGTMIQALKQVAVESAIDVNAKIAQARLSMLDTLIRARDIGVNLVNVLGSLGAAEQANLVRGKIAEIEAQASIIQSQIAAQAQVQTALINAKADLERAQLGLLGDVFQTVVGTRLKEEEFKLAPFEILTRLATGLPPISRGQQTGGIIPALGDLFNIRIGS